MDYYKMENANHYTYLIGEDKDGSPVHNYCIGSNGIVEVQWASMVWEEIGRYDSRTNSITVTKDRRRHCRVLRNFGYDVK